MHGQVEIEVSQTWPDSPASGLVPSPVLSSHLASPTALPSQRLFQIPDSLPHLLQSPCPFPLAQLGALSQLKLTWKTKKEDQQESQGPHCFQEGDRESSPRGERGMEKDSRRREAV